jgi:hypothetical protein
VQSIHWRVEPLEVLPAVLASVDAVIGSGQNGSGLFRVDRQAEHTAFGPQSGPHLPPALTAVRADPGAGSYGAGTDREIIGHGCFLPKFVYLVFVSQPV